MAWNLVSVSWINRYMTVAGWQNIANLIGGSVSSAEDLGITSISGLTDETTPPSMSDMAVYVADGANYGIIAYGGNNNKVWQDCCLYIIPLETGDITVAGTTPSGIAETNPTVRVWVGDGFSVVSSMQNTSYVTGGFCIDSFTDSVNDRTVVGVVGSNSVNSYPGFDLYNGTSLSGSPVGASITQTDGALYIEVIKLPLVSSSEVLIAENLYRRFYDYNTDEKNVAINGIAFTSLLTTEIFFPAE